MCMSEKGINFLFPVQTSTYDHIYDGHDVIVQASKHSSCMMLQLLTGNCFLIATALLVTTMCR